MTTPSATPTASPSTPALFGSGLRAGMLTFGGAYAAIPFLKRDAVETGAWMTERDFLDGVTAGVVGLIVVTALRLALTAISGPSAAVIGAVALRVLYLWKSRIARSGPDGRRRRTRRLFTLS